MFAFKIKLAIICVLNLFISIKSMETIKTKKFTLRPILLKDAKDLAKNLNNWNVVRYLSSLPFPYELQHAKQYIKRMNNEAKKEHPENYVLAIEINNEVVGAVAIHKMAQNHKAEMGYWLAEQHWGKGIMPEAVKKFLPHVFSKFKLRRVCAKVYSPNKGSMKVAEKAGMKFEGIERKGVLKNGKYIDCHIYAKVK